MDWIIDTESEPGYWLVRCGDVVDSRWLSQGAAAARHAMLADAREEMLTAAGSSSDGTPFYAVLVVEDWDTGDGRYMESCAWESLPLPLWTLDTQEGWGHMGSEASGSIRTIERMADGRRIFATGMLASTEEGQQTATQIQEQVLRFVSVDPAQGTEWEEEVTQVDQNGDPVDGRIRFAPYIIGGATVVGAPACRFACIWLDGMDAPSELALPLPDPEPRVVAPEVVYREPPDDYMDDDWTARTLPELLALSETPELTTLLASAREQRDGGACVLTENCGGPALPPAEWFADPGLSGPTPLTVTADGRIYGHLALWNEPHRGFLHYQWSDQVYAPRSSSGYAHFLVHRTPVACCSDAGCGHERQLVPTGVLAFGTLHAGQRLSAQTVRRWYEDTGMAGADVTVGEDAFGPWVSGALRPGMDDARVREVLGSTLSGDWRRIGGNLELHGALGVNSGGFPICASAVAGEDGIDGLILSGPQPAQDAPAELVASVASTLRSRAAQRPSGAAASRASRMEGLPPLADVVRDAVAEALAPVIADLQTLQPLVVERLEADLATLG